MLLETSVFAPKDDWFSSNTLAALRRNKIRTIADLVDLGRAGIRTEQGGLDRNAIKEISQKLFAHGIDW
jgi:hypothetical protein